MHQRLRATVSDALFGTTALIWVGMLVGVSFVATPVKFTAPGLSLPVALEVGRVTFHLFSRIEWALAAFLFVISVSRMFLARTALAVSLILLVAVQAVWLLPALDARLPLSLLGVPCLRASTIRCMRPSSWASFCSWRGLVFSD